MFDSSRGPNGKFVLSGVASFGTESDSCSPDASIGFARVEEKDILEWIVAEASDDEDALCPRR